MNKSIISESKLKSILLDEDPGNVYIKELKNEDEYDIEIKTIMKLFLESVSEEIFIERVSKLFSRSFEETGKKHKYKEIAKKIWNVHINTAETTDQK